MAADSSVVTADSIVNFLKAKGGKATHAELIGRFRDVLPDAPGQREAARLRFKTCVNRVAFVRPEDGVKHVLLRRKHAVPPADEYTPGPGPGNESQTSGFLQEKQEDVKQPEDEVDDDGQSLSGSEGGVSPKGSRRHFLQVMMSSSPQVRRSLLLRGDGDSASLDDERPAVALDPLEHEWMLCASDGEWSSLQRLLGAEPGLIMRKDFITGFTCLHWAAKQGKAELLALIINFAKQSNIPLSVDVRSNAGYTPLHVAAMQNHLEVVKLLVGAYNADVEIRDYSGRKACQYLADGVSADIWEILGVCPDNAHRMERSRPSLSKVFQSNLRILGDSMDVEVRAWEKPLRRKSSFTKMRPKLEKLRRRASQIMHSTTFREEETEEDSERSFFHLRPKTHEFG